MMKMQGDGSRLGRLAAVSLLLPVMALMSAAQEKVPRFVDGKCAIQPDPGVKTRCGELVVYENRSRPGGRTITLPVIIVKSTSADPSPDPVFYTGGGPGGSSLGRVRGASRLTPYTRDRDFIIFEQRGTRYAKPALQCPEVPIARHLAFENRLTGPKTAKAEIDAVKKCRERLVADDIDLSAYDSAASAADMEDLRTSLGISRWNLYGVSYSTRLMLNYIREYPSSVRSVILDSVLPPTVNYDETSVDGVLRSLNVLFAACKADADCSRSFPDLQASFRKAVANAEKRPVLVNAKVGERTIPVYLDGASIVDLIYNLLEDTGALSRIPLVIDQLARGHYDSIDQLQGYAVQRLTSQGFVWGMRYSVWCREEMPFQDVLKIRAQLNRSRGLAGFGIQETFPSICRVWGVRPAGKIENEAVRTDTPMLVFAGEFDPDTPPAWGRIVASWSTKSHFYEFKGTSHGVLFSNRCAIAEIVPSFLAEPEKRPNDACLAAEKAISFDQK